MSKAFPPVGPGPCEVVCPSCNATVHTRVVHKTTTRTHMMALAMMICCLLCPCACIPYCTNSCRDATHYCPNCTAYLGAYKR